MNTARKHTRRAQGGYSLVELLLTVALLLLFVGLGVVSMQTMSQGSGLAEGTLRFETVLRFARAEAARSGHRVRVTFVQDTNDVATATNQLNHVQLEWEPDPTGQPDVFQEMISSQWGVDQVNETVAVETVRLIDSLAEPAPAGESIPEEMADDTEFDEAPDTAVAMEPMAEPSSITFNPDGSSDSAEVTLASRTVGDDRRTVVRLEGFTGTVSRMDPPVKDVAETSPAPNQSSDLPL